MPQCPRLTCRISATQGIRTQQKDPAAWVHPCGTGASLSFLPQKWEKKIKETGYLGQSSREQIAPLFHTTHKPRSHCPPFFNMMDQLKMLFSITGLPFLRVYLCTSGKLFMPTCTTDLQDASLSSFFTNSCHSLILAHFTVLASLGKSCRNDFDFLSWKAN